MAPINAKPSLTLETNQNMPPPPTTSVAAAAGNPKPILKLNTGARQPSLGGDGATPTPSTEKKTIKIKLNSQPSTPASAAAAQNTSIMKTKAGRTSKPTAKLTESKKRGYESDEDKPMAASRAESGRPSKMIKIRPSVKTPSTPFAVNTPISTIRFKPRGEPILRTPGDAYDSEASDRELDPQRETNFILRVMDGPPAEYLRKAVAEGTIGLSKANGGADFEVQFVDAKERRAVVTINEQKFAAVLVQLPTITEAMKTWDRKSMMKNSDVTEMLLCFALVGNEQEAKVAPLPNMVAKNDLRWPHGITPPMHDAANQRFRKTLSEKQWQSTQDRVEKLLADDRQWDDVRVEYVNDEDGDADFEDDEDAEGELEQDDYFGPDPGTENDYMDVDADADGDADEDNLLEAALEEELAGDIGDGQLTAVTPGTQLEAPTPMTMDANTPAALPAASEEEEDEDEEDVSDEDDDEDDEDIDDEQRAADKNRKQQLSELHHLESKLVEAEHNFNNAKSQIMKRRIAQNIENYKKEIAVKKGALGMTSEDD
ncbi:hypothetical protein GGR56DRAFT_619400 [Xylariaceae sp. FL0804]|nr:hypothetical protein GGR56DRAFT_619400 [Xylariaceae sp. FL0804]